MSRRTARAIRTLLADLDGDDLDDIIARAKERRRRLVRAEGSSGQPGRPRKVNDEDRKKIAFPKPGIRNSTLCEVFGISERTLQRIRREERAKAYEADLNDPI